MNKFILYLGGLLMIVALRTSVAPPSLLYRLLFIIALFLPLFFKGYKIFLPCLITFITVNNNSFAFGYLPYEIAAYVIISFIALLIYKSINNSFKLKIEPLFFCAIMYIFIINLCYSGNPQNIFWCVAIISIGAYLVDRDCLQNRIYMLNAFAIISFILSILYLLNYEAFLNSYSINDKIERSGWTDPNYLSCIVGMGLISSLVLLLESWTQKTYIKLFLVCVILVSTMSQILMASRGGIICTSVSSILLVMLMKVKTRYKITTILAICCFVALLYANNYFELFAYRMENDSMDSGRMEIWSAKLLHFINDGNIFTWLFGIGYENAFNLSDSSQTMGFHNDFLAILCGYGVLGLILFIYIIFIVPFANIHRSDRPILISLIVYLLIASLTLEPLASGNITFWAFYYLILLFSGRYKMPLHNIHQIRMN